MILINIPLLVICYKYLGKLFAIPINKKIVYLVTEKVNLFQNIYRKN